METVDRKANSTHLILPKDLLIRQPNLNTILVCFKKLKT